MRVYITVQDNTKALNTLMSNNSSIVQKRQVMRLSFGNYREKIAAAEEKASKSKSYQLFKTIQYNVLFSDLSNIKVKPAKPDKKSVFVKKSFSLSHGDNNFKFNFAALSENVENNSNADEITFKQNEIWNRKERMCQYLPSDNSFRFNFEVDEAMS